MLKTAKMLFLLCSVISLGKSQEKAYTKFTDTITVRENVIYNARMTGIESPNLLYAVCENSNPVERHCNFSLQKESQKLVCPVRVTASDPVMERLSELIIYPLDDDKVVITWSNNGWKATQFKILEMSTCKLVDVPLATNQVIFITIYKSAIDIGFYDETYCGSKTCKVTVNADGKLISGPTAVLKDVDLTFIEPVGAVNENAPDQGFYASAGNGQSQQKQHNFYQINGQGKSVHVATLKGAKYGRSSNSQNLFSLCYTFGKTNTKLICLQYDKSLKLKLNKTIEFEDGKSQRWWQPYNLKKGGLLLVSGKPSETEVKRYDAFSIVKIHEDGQRDKAVELDNLNFICGDVRSLNANVLEKESSEICVHFTCTRGGTDKGQKTSTLQLAIQCLPKTSNLL